MQEMKSLTVYASKGNKEYSISNKIKQYKIKK